MSSPLTLLLLLSQVMIASQKVDQVNFFFWSCFYNERNKLYQGSKLNLLDGSTIEAVRVSVDQEGSEGRKIKGVGFTFLPRLSQSTTISMWFYFPSKLPWFRWNTNLSTSQLPSMSPGRVTRWRCFSSALFLLAPFYWPIFYWPIFHSPFLLAHRLLGGGVLGDERSLCKSSWWAWAEDCLCQGWSSESNSQLGGFLDRGLHPQVLLSISSSATGMLYFLLSFKVLHPGGWGEGVGQWWDGAGDHESEPGYQEDHHHHGLRPGGQCTLLHGPWDRYGHRLGLYKGIGVKIGWWDNSSNREPLHGDRYTFIRDQLDQQSVFSANSSSCPATPTS